MRYRATRSLLARPAGSDTSSSTVEFGFLLGTYMLSMPGCAFVKWAYYKRQQESGAEICGWWLAEIYERCEMAQRGSKD